MDAALWLLLRLRLVGALRRWFRTLRTIKGILLTLVGGLLFAPMVLASVFAPPIQFATQLALIRRYGPLGSLAFCLLNVILSSNERAIYFAPAEVEFLFSGPFRRRQLLIYKMASGFLSIVFTALLMTLFFAHHANALVPAFVGLFLMFELLYLVAMAVGLCASTLGAHAFDLRRKMLLVAISGLLLALVASRGHSAFAMTRIELLRLLEESTVLRMLSWPFRPAIMAFTADRLWPDLAAWSLPGMAILAALAGAILVLDAEYYEASAAASTRIYERLRSSRRGSMATRASRARVTLPMVPWWWGTGPGIWRQLTTASRHPDRVVILLIFYLCPLLPVILTNAFTDVSDRLDYRFLLMMLAGLTLGGSLILGFDFRSDVDRMDALKTLPVAAWALVVAELVVPVLFLSLAQALCLVIASFARGDATMLIESLLLLPFYNALLVETEALLFLWFPTRVVPGTSLDFSVVGREILIMFSKLLVVGIAAGVAVGSGALCYYGLSSNWWGSLGVVALVLSGFVVALIPLNALAFQQLDAALDRPW